MAGEPDVDTALSAVASFPEGYHYLSQGNEDDTGRTYVELAMTVAAQMMRQRIKFSASDELGVVFYGAVSAHLHLPEHGSCWHCMYLIVDFCAGPHQVRQQPVE
jgi:hypothetical protein